ncbi:ATP-binding protein [Streptomyces sp. NPDC093510]|uniref:ATP-binding protein n=1 Tax=Streptomyces sp. NPDC093510 TaxID=3155199 RepID=UPI00343D0C68
MVTVTPAEGWSYALHLPHDPRAPRVARMTLRAALDGHGMSELVEVAELLTSEMVTNAYRHTKGPASLRLRSVRAGRLRVGVWDTSSHIPAPFDKPPAIPGGSTVPPASDDSDGGRGLHLVHECADSWGGWLLGDQFTGGGGKLLWFELRGAGPQPQRTEPQRTEPQRTEPRGVELRRTEPRGVGVSTRR